MRRRPCNLVLVRCSNVNHRRLTWPLVCLAGLIWVSTAYGQDTKIGFVDMKRLFAEAAQVQLVRENLDREFRPRNEAVLADEGRVAELQDELAANDTLSPLERQAMENDIRNLQRSVARRREDLQEEIRFRTNSETNALETTIALAVDEVAKAGGYDLILTSPVAYASERVDITQEVLDWLALDAENLGQRP